MGRICFYPVAGCSEHEVASIAQPRARKSASGVSDLSTFQPQEARPRNRRGCAQAVRRGADGGADACHEKGTKRFDINQLAAEYGALRASVLGCGPRAVRRSSHLEDMIRFNEAIAQAFAESIQFLQCASRPSA